MVKYLMALLFVFLLFNPALAQRHFTQANYVIADIDSIYTDSLTASVDLDSVAFAPDGWRPDEAIIYFHIDRVCTAATSLEFWIEVSEDRTIWTRYCSGHYSYNEYYAKSTNTTAKGWAFPIYPVTFRYIRGNLDFTGAAAGYGYYATLKITTARRTR